MMASTALFALALSRPAAAVTIGNGGGDIFGTDDCPFGASTRGCCTDKSEGKVCILSCVVYRGDRANCADGLYCDESTNRCYPRPRSLGQPCNDDQNVCAVGLICNEVNKCAYPPTPKPTPNPFSPSLSPTELPTRRPSAFPTAKPSPAPSRSPTRKPTWSPTRKPTWSPTRKPTWSPTRKPTWSPTRKPTWSPTSKPTWKPTAEPTPAPSVLFSCKPVEFDLDRPTVAMCNEVSEEDCSNGVVPECSWQVADGPAYCIPKSDVSYDIEQWTICSQTGKANCGKFTPETWKTLDCQWFLN